MYMCIRGHSLCKPLHASVKYAGNGLLALNILYNMVSVYLSFTLYIFCILDTFVRMYCICIALDGGITYIIIRTYIFVDFLWM